MALKTFAKETSAPEREEPIAPPPPCRAACPSDIDIPRFVALIAHGRHEEALRTIRASNPFPWVCGLICPNPCEGACVRGALDEAVGIRPLKAFAAKWAEERGAYPTPTPAPSNGRKVAIAGSGPAGLSAAHFLALEGYRVTIFESLPVAGGLLMVGIPEYRLPRWIVQREIDSIRSMGVEIKTGVTLGKDVSFEQLRDRGYDAFFLATGAHRGFKLGIEGEEDYPQIHDAISFLRAVSLGEREKPAESVVVVGGGNSAMDAARTCIRLGSREVRVAYRRTREQMPANPEEIEQAMEEGVLFDFLAVPVKVAGVRGQVAHLECLRAELGEPDAGGKRRPVPVAGSNFLIPAGAIITAIGQQPDLRCFPDELPFKVTRRGLIATEGGSTRTGAGGNIFAAGDAVTGPATVVQAIAGGKRAAMEIDRYLAGSTELPAGGADAREERIPFVPLSAQAKISLPRNPAPMIASPVRKNNFDLVESGYTESLAVAEAKRCLRCDACIRCGACERVCREAIGVDALHFVELDSTERILRDYARPGEFCITCGACALACPTGAMECTETSRKRELRLCGTLLNRQEVLTCPACGGAFVPSRFLHYVMERTKTVPAVSAPPGRDLCPACARRTGAERFAAHSTW
jgi:NADPH-dependent glutamate synthase beta subunit-like oxidoreductase/Fe-S-cluster-containing hydrogenase component 2